MQNSKTIEEYMNANKLDLEMIVNDYTPYIKTIIENAVGEVLTYEDKEEMITDTFFIIWKNQDKIFVSVSSYIAGIVRNLIREKLRKKKVTYDISEYENLVELSKIELFESERDEIEDIEKCFKNLNKIDKEIITMFYYSSKTIMEIAKEVNLSVINVKTRLHRIRKKIRKDLGVGE
ncbi:MAG: sigma-70 family RNA polymerase sigma factor [Clostridia bacterium]|nr:sigma-70 family RNA polymerase sigma factor [Clostridia bacterium]